MTVAQSLGMVHNRDARGATLSEIADDTRLNWREIEAELYRLRAERTFAQDGVVRWCLPA